MKDVDFSVLALNAERIAALWRKPVLSDTEIPVAIGLADSSWQALKRLGDCPPLFKIGRRTFSLTENVRKWLEHKGKAA